MMSTTKPDLARGIARDFGISYKMALEILDRAFDTIAEEVAVGRIVYIKGIGSFMVKNHPPKTRWDVVKGVKVIDEAKREPKFRPSREFKEKCNLRQ